MSEALEGLKLRSLPLGLIRDCGPDVPFVWWQLPLARLIDESVFTCKEGLKKSAEAINRTAVDDPKSSLMSVSRLATEAGRS